MALGDINPCEAPGVFAFGLLSSAIATNSPPAGASAGLAMSIVRAGLGGGLPDQMTLIIRSTAGSGTMTVTCRLWGYYTVAADWFPLGTGTGATSGVINVATALTEAGADVLRHAEPIYTPAHFSRLYLEITAIGGTSTAITAELVGKVIA